MLTITGHLSQYSDLQKKYTYKSLLSALTQALVMATIMKELYANFDAIVLVTKDYLMHIPALLLTLPFVRRVVRNNPINCYRIKGILSVGGLVMLLFVEIFNGSKLWYLVDAAIVAVTPLLMSTHRAYYNSKVVDNNKDFSETLGLLDVFGKLAYIVLGLGILYSEIPTVYLLFILVILESVERILENQCVSVVYGDE